MKPDRGSPPRKPSRDSRKARSLRTRRPILIAVALAAIHYLALATALTAAVLFAIDPSMDTAKVLIATVAFAIATWIAAWFRRKAALCPLCKGTPLLNTGAMPHALAYRFPPFNHGVTAILTTLFSLHFRCMYCGSHYDLLRSPHQPKDGPAH